MSWRQDAVERLEDFCGLNPTAIGVGRGPIKSTLNWVNHSMKQRGGPQQGLEAERAERRLMRYAKLEECFKALQSVLHELEGTVEGDYATREMAIAGTHLDTAWLWAREALEQ